MEKDLVLYIGERVNKKGYPYYTFKIEYKNRPYYFRIPMSKDQKKEFATYLKEAGKTIDNTYPASVYNYTLDVKYYYDEINCGHDDDTGEEIIIKESGLLINGELFEPMNWEDQSFDTFYELELELRGIAPIVIFDEEIGIKGVIFNEEV